MEKIITIDGHNVGVTNGLSGVETIRYDGIEMSSKFVFSGGVHIFTVNENGNPIIFEVRLNSVWHGMSYTATIKKNGQVVFSEPVKTSITSIFIYVVIGVFAGMSLVIGNPSANDHYSAITDQVKVSGFEFLTREIAEHSCIYHDYGVFSVTKNGAAICSVGYLWHVSVR